MTESDGAAGAVVVPLYKLGPMMGEVTQEERLAREASLPSFVITDSKRG